MIVKQNKSKLVLIIIGLLLVVNIILLSFFLLKRQKSKTDVHQGRKVYIAAFLEEEIGFNKQQLQQYDSLSNRHREIMKAEFDKIRNHKEEQFKQLVGADFNDSAIYTIAEQATATQKLIQIRSFKHLRSIRQMCTVEQQAKFDTSFYKVFNRKGKYFK